MDVSLLKPFAEHYACDINSVEVECKLVIKLLQRIEAERKCKIETLLQLVTVLEEYNKMTNNRLSDLAVLAVERSLANKIDLQRVVDMFDAAHNNRRIRLH
ncbi:hypothetical protein MRX96_031945 [Rhipicephalus microplus]